MSSRVTRLKSQKFQDNIAAKRGQVLTTEPAEKKEAGYTVSPYLLGFIFFVLVGSSVFELLKNVGGKK